MAPIRTFLVGLLLAGSVTSAIAQTNQPPPAQRPPAIIFSPNDIVGHRYRPIGQTSRPDRRSLRPSSVRHRCRRCRRGLGIENRATIDARLSPR
jgi:hypothetical protein